MAAPGCSRCGKTISCGCSDLVYWIDRRQVTGVPFSGCGIVSWIDRQPHTGDTYLAFQGKVPATEQRREEDGDDRLLFGRLQWLCYRIMASIVVGAAAELAFHFLIGPAYGVVMLLFATLMTFIFLRD